MHDFLHISILKQIIAVEEFYLVFLSHNCCQLYRKQLERDKWINFLNNIVI